MSRWVVSGNEMGERRGDGGRSWGNEVNGSNQNSWPRDRGSIYRAEGKGRLCAVSRVRPAESEKTVVAGETGVRKRTKQARGRKEEGTRGCRSAGQPLKRVHAQDCGVGRKEEGGQRAGGGRGEMKRETEAMQHLEASVIEPVNSRQQRRGRVTLPSWEANSDGERTRLKQPEAALWG